MDNPLKCGSTFYVYSIFIRIWELLYTYNSDLVEYFWASGALVNGHIRIESNKKFDSLAKLPMRFFTQPINTINITSIPSFSWFHGINYFRFYIISFSILEFGHNSLKCII